MNIPLRDVSAGELAQGNCRDPFALLGAHEARQGFDLRAFLPMARRAALCRPGQKKIEMANWGDGLFVAPGLKSRPRAGKYKIEADWGNGPLTFYDPYAFAPVLSDYDLHLFQEGRLFEMAKSLGANLRTLEGVAGVHFAVWAPNAHSVAVVGDFNGWNETRHPMRLRIEAGVWEIFIPEVERGARYKFAIAGNAGRKLPWKADPLAKQAEVPPATASVVADGAPFQWTDARWIERRASAQTAEAPISIYEVHVESWLRTDDGCRIDWQGAIDRLIPYARDLGFTHLELLPVMSYPFGGSWGYQPLGLFAPTARLGAPQDFARFVDACHAAGLGVFLDWVPAHFPNDVHGLVEFDGTALYEHADPRQGFQRDWNTLIYNFGRHEVRDYLIASALHWLEAFHVDGLRVDAVASMLYLDYSRAEGEWIPNIHGGRENLEAIAFLRELNVAVRARVPGAVMIAEESTAFPGVTAPVEQGGLGFHFKWNMGWMHDTLRHFQRDPIHRQWHAEDILFGLSYAFSENYVLPLSHDEVVHGKGSLLSRMPGDDWRRHAHMRLLFALMWTHPGKKLLFMGGEFAQDGEWRHDDPFPWPDAARVEKLGLRALLGDLNRLYRGHSALFKRDARADGFRWIIADDRANSVFAYLRHEGDLEQGVVVALNFTPEPRHDYRIGVPFRGVWREMANTDAACYGGSGLGNSGGGWTQDIPAHGYAQSVVLTLPPLAAIILKAD